MLEVCICLMDEAVDGNDDDDDDEEEEEEEEEKGDEEEKYILLHAYTIDNVADIIVPIE